MSLTKSTLQKLVLIYVPERAGVSGNERADALTKTATMSQGGAMDRGDILTALKEAGHGELNDSCDDSHTLSRLVKFNLKKGVAKKENLAGRTRRMVNQHRTGTISKHTLGDLLSWRSWHLGTLFGCIDDNPD